MMTGHIDPTKDVFAAFRENNRPGPIHMLNLVRLHAQARYPDGRKATGAEAYAAYGRESGPVFTRLGGEAVVGEFLSNMPGGANGAVFVVMFIVFILGMFLDTFEILFIVVPISAPILLKMDVDPVWLSIMLAVNLQTSYLTPPFGFSLFFLRGVAPPEVTTGHIYRGIVPFVGLQILALAIVWVFPQLATWLPTVIYGK